MPLCTNVRAQRDNLYRVAQFSLLGGVEAFADDRSPSVEESAQKHGRDNDERGRGSIVKNEAPKNHAKDDRGDPNDRSGSKI